jgi:hypothetical protein
MPRYAALLAAACAGCTILPLDRPVPPPPPPLEGQRAAFVCLRFAPSGVCLRSEWRCTMPLQLTWDYDGNPRCVVPGAR